MTTHRLALLLLLLAAKPLMAGALVPAPRPLSAAEEAAAQIAVHYLGGGAQSVIDDLAASSPLRTLSHADAILEIESRLGPVGRAKWRLDTAMPSLAEHSALFTVMYPSGIDDAIRFDLVQEGGRWRLKNISTSAEPVDQPALLRRDDAPREPVVPANRRSDQRVALALVLPALALSIGAAAAGRRRPAVTGVLLLIAAGALIAGTGLAIKPLFSARQIQVAAKKRGDQPSLIRLGALVPLRKALAAGDPPPAINLAAGPARDVADLWTAQSLFQQERATDAKKIVVRFPRPTKIPLVELLRARIALEEAKDLDAVTSYERAMDLGPGSDALWLEASEAFSILGFDDRSERYLRRAADVGSREGSVFYANAVLAVMDHSQVRAGLFLTAAWQMQPLERGDLFHVTPLWDVLRQPQMLNLLQPHVATEPVFASKRSVRPMVVAADAQSTVMGDLLRITTGEAVFVVPGGGVIAPANAKTMDAGSWRREQEQIALADFEPLRRVIRSGADIVRPAISLRCVHTLSALAGRNRWDDVVALTDPLPPKEERVPVSLTILRGEALSRLGRIDALRQLIVDVLHNPALKRKKDPVALAEIAELVAAVDEYDGAIALLDRARRALDLPGIDRRIEQLTLEKSLASASSSLATEHFDIRYPKAMPPERAQKMGTILEAELRRLRASWFPTVLPKRITVDVLSWEDFKNYTGSEYIAGLYTNKIMLPLGNVPYFPPEIVAIMTHELAHALIAEASNNLAPRWFHEALATRLEMNEESQNAFQIYRDQSFLTVALLDAVADGSPDPDLVAEAYQIGATTLRFIEARYGKAAIGKMVAAFRAGATTEEAVQAATGGSVADLDRLARAWGATQPTLFIGSVVQYDAPPKRNTEGPTWTHPH